MKKGIVLCAALLLSACSSTIDNTYYQLPSSPAAMPVRRGGIAQPPALWVQQVAVPDYLAGNGLVYQTSDVKYVIAANNLWAGPLDQQLQQTLVANLSKALPGRLVSAAPLGYTHDTLSVTVTGFQGRYDGRAVISGEWVLQHSGQVIKQGFNLALPQQEDGYDALVRTLALGWQQTAQQIANAAASAE
ncbi:membrane integrity-associated transporter subunit PqiC [Candidatus Pantoea persica]|uniref:membrane integrity-associated transporter subunit PqiC n=1 Tax=Candidatus Pantoea persica TaxID=2518128 RepID=UPI00215D8E27|nr:membrane integrity-associated transporter subunit PqiC [Candidatus Pantoea persica]MBA2814907.1 lipoprotein [Candidatus Pantoea persica]